ncbi:MAG: response regulator, partial [Polyangiaceae bacterium]
MIGKAAPATRADPGGIVLIVDDDGILRRALARFLARDGHEPVQAASGKEALDILGARRIDVMLSDIHMPDMNGVDLLKTVRAAHPEIPVVLMTGAPAIDTAMKAVEYGAIEYLTKPLDETRLLGSVGRALKVHRDARAQRELLDSVVREKAASASQRTPDGALVLGTVLANRYRILRVLGAGGMGA